jgi:alanine racemase
MNRSKAIINTKAIRHNLRIIRQTSGTKIIGIVKANGYGFGITEISKILREEKVEILGVPYVHEAEQLRKSGDVGEILITGSVSIDQVDDIVNNEFQVSIANTNVLNELNEEAKKKNTIIKIHIFVDTGMNREGVRTDELEPLMIKLKSYKYLKVIGCLTHLISSDDDDKKQSEQQLSNFEDAKRKIKDVFGQLDYTHSHNSAAIFSGIKNYSTYSRPGLSIYGYLPNRKLFDKSKLQMGLELTSEVTLIKKVLKGENIGYSNKFIADKDMKIALIPIGYGHGYPWKMFNKGVFEINGKACNTVGSVCMDFTMVDITGLKVNEGDRVTVIGNSGIVDDIYDVAEKVGTIPYEIITQLLPRIERVYI